jgi:DNA polymerase-3 subunit epsilon
MRSVGGANIPDFGRRIRSSAHDRPLLQPLAMARTLYRCRPKTQRGWSDSQPAPRLFKHSVDAPGQQGIGCQATSLLSSFPCQQSGTRAQESTGKAHMLQHLSLQRPLVFLDCETTGLDPCHDRLVELGLLRVSPENPLRSAAWRFNPQIPIPVAATRIHSLGDDDVAHCPLFRQVAGGIARWLKGADLAGFNLCKFDLPILAAEFERAGMAFSLSGRFVVDAMSIYHACNPRNLAAAVRQYCGHNHEHGHRALQDATAVAAVLDGMLGRHGELPRTVAGLHQRFVEVDIGGWFRLDPTGVVVFARGKYRTQPLQSVARCDPSYLRWLSRQILLADARDLIEAALEPSR